MVPNFAVIILLIYITSLLRSLRYSLIPLYWTLDQVYQPFVNFCHQTFVSVSQLCPQHGNLVTIFHVFNTILSYTKLSLNIGCLFEEHSSMITFSMYQLCSLIKHNNQYFHTFVYWMWDCTEHTRKLDAWNLKLLGVSNSLFYQL